MSISRLNPCENGHCGADGRHRVRIYIKELDMYVDRNVCAYCKSDLTQNDNYEVLLL